MSCNRVLKSLGPLVIVVVAGTNHLGPEIEELLSRLPSTSNVQEAP